jgi:hypothetical protein
MASTYSTSLRLELMATGDQSGTWGDTTNTNLGTLLEQAITGVLSVAQGDAELTLTSTDGASDQARNAVVNLTGAMTSAQNVVVPNANKLYLIKNSTSGGFAVTVKTSAGTGVTVPAGTARWVYADGTNVVDGMSGPWAPSSNDAQALGLSATAWSDLFLASGGVINWNAGNFTLTHSAGLLTANGTLAATGSGVGFTAFQAISTNADAAAGPIIELYRNSASPTTSDILGQVLFNGEDSAGNKQEYGSIEAVISDATSASEDALMNFYLPVAGARTLALSLGPTATGAIGGSQIVVRSDVAAQADQETGTSTTTFVSPGRQQFHQSAVKFWGYFFNEGTISASYNVASITDVGTGVVGVTIATDFSSASWACVCSPQNLDGAPTLLNVSATTAQAAGSVRINSYNSVSVLTDPNTYNVLGLGDQ